jgi:protein TonB
LNANNTSLFGFILISAALHILLIFAWQVDNNSRMSITPSSSPLMLTLTATQPQQAIQQQARKPVSRPVHRQISIPKKTVSRKNTVARLKTNNAQQISEQKASTDTVIKQVHTAVLAKTKADTAIASEHRNQDQQLGARIQKQLRLKIAFHSYYPGMAIRNAWEGRVKLGIRVQANGDLTDIHVIDSSGYRILDTAAVKSVRHIAALPEASPWLQGQSIDVILPVIYKLTDS